MHTPAPCKALLHAFCRPWCCECGNGGHADVSKAGRGSGTVTSSVGAIDCGSICSDAFAAGTPATLTASAAAGSQFNRLAGRVCGLPPVN
jgi:hypothetical protein